MLTARNASNIYTVCKPGLRSARPKWKQSFHATYSSISDEGQSNLVKQQQHEWLSFSLAGVSGRTVVAAIEVKSNLETPAGLLAFSQRCANNRTLKSLKLLNTFKKSYLSDLREFQFLVEIAFPHYMLDIASTEDL